MKTVLVISHADDGTTKILSERFREMDQQYNLIDLSLFPSQSVASIDYSCEEPFVRFRQDDQGFDSNTVTGVWWRRPKGKLRGVSTDPLDKYIEAESEVFIRSLFQLLPDVTWVSDPENTRIANSKPFQLRVAKKMGFKIPRTVISNDPQVVLDFLKNNKDLRLIMKPVGTGHFRFSPEGNHQDLVVYTRIINPEEVQENINLVRNCPVIFQEAIVEKIDIRITVVGRNVFAVSIHHDADAGAGSDNVDWRNHKLNRIYKPFRLPEGLECLCRDYVEYFGLRFGVIDMCLSSDGEYYFLEINPQGQWVPSELVAGMPISQALADLLTC
jgi:glutathione synthase/RimK-type ligase-like ATP-grasp enzyme